MAGSAESVEQVWLLRRVVTVCWLAAGSVLAGRASGGVSRVSYTTEYYDFSFSGRPTASFAMGEKTGHAGAYYLMACPHLLLRLRFFPHGLHRTRGLTH